MSLLSTPFRLGYAYERTTGPVLGRFFAELRECRIVGARCADGSVIVPPAEADPRTGLATGECVEVGPSGVITTWTWVESPREGQPLDRPFAWALIKLDGADSGLLHAVDAAEARLATGLRVRPRWREERTGSISDILCFEPDDG